MDSRSLSDDVREPFASVPVGSGDMAMVEEVAVNSRIDETQRGGGYNYVSISIVLVFIYFLTVGKVHKCSRTPDYSRALGAAHVPSRRQLRFHARVSGLL